MRKILIPVFILTLLLGYLPAQAAGGYPGGIEMAPASVPVDPEIEAAVAQVLSQDAQSRGVYHYAISNVDYSDPYYYVSVVGFPYDANYDYANWHLEDGLYLGLVSLVYVPETGGYAGVIQNMTVAAEPEPASSPAIGLGGAGDLLPIQDGTSAWFGPRGVHDCGFSLAGWKAVDLVSYPNNGMAPNMVYASKAGSVSYVCRDGTQVAVRIDKNLYVHLEDTGQAVGHFYNQGQGIAPMIVGTFADTCGWADQDQTHYHVHFCFVPVNGTYTADNYVLDVAANRFQNMTTGEFIEPNGLITAHWQNANPSTPPPGTGQPPPTSGNGNFWDSIIAGLVGIVGKFVPVLPDHQAWGLAERVMSIAAVALQVIYVILLTNFDMTVPIFCLTVWFLMESARIIYAGWMLVKKAIPIVG